MFKLKNTWKDTTYLLFFVLVFGFWSFTVAETIMPQTYHDEGRCKEKKRKTSIRGILNE